MNLSQQLYQSLVDDIEDLTMSSDFQWHWWTRAKELKHLDPEKYKTLMKEKDRILKRTEEAEKLSFLAEAIEEGTLLDLGGCLFAPVGWFKHR